MKGRGPQLATLALVTGLAAGGGTWLLDHPAYLHTMGILGAGVLAAGAAGEVLRESKGEKQAPSSKKRSKKKRRPTTGNGVKRALAAQTAAHTAAPPPVGRKETKAGSGASVSERTITVRWEADKKKAGSVVGHRQDGSLVVVDNAYRGTLPDVSSTWRAKVVRRVGSKLTIVEPLELLTPAPASPRKPTRPQKPKVDAAKQAAEMLDAEEKCAAAKASRAAVDAATNLEGSLRARILGQDAALAEIVKELRGRFAREKRRGPITTLFFVGVTGSGKTETAKLLAELLEMHFLRLDGGDFYDRQTASRLVGSPPGYIGSDRGGQLTRPVREHPKSVVLFDEIEKADPGVHKMLLPLMDEGILTDSSDGQVSDFSDCILVFTSNLAQDDLAGVAEKVGDNSSLLNTEMKKILTSSGLPREWVGRIRRVVYFQKLGRDAQLQILLKLVRETADSLGVELDDVAPEVLKLLYKSAGGEEFGVRGMSATVEDQIVDLLIPHKDMGGRVRLVVEEGAIGAVQA